MHSCTLRNNGDTITFHINEFKEQAIVTYHFGFDNFTEVKKLFKHEAQEHWDKAMELGYKVTMPTYMTSSRYDW